MQSINTPHEEETNEEEHCAYQLFEEIEVRNCLCSSSSDSLSGMFSSEGDFLSKGPLSLMQKATSRAMMTGMAPKRKGIPRNRSFCGG